MPALPVASLADPMVLLSGKAVVRCLPLAFRSGSRVKREKRKETMSEIKRQPKPNILYEENREKFNALVAEGKIPDLRNQNMSDLDLRGFNLSRADLSGGYLRGANLSGQDLSESNLSGVSLRNANVSGCLFPKDLPIEEIRMSLDFGTRIRHR